eukprot:963528-Rhodomonas_salina.4
MAPGPEAMSTAAPRDAGMGIDMGRNSYPGTHVRDKLSVSLSTLKLNSNPFREVNVKSLGNGCRQSSIGPVLP